MAESKIANQVLTPSNVVAVPDAAPAPTPVVTPAPTPAPEPASWTAGFDEDSLAYVNNKGWKDIPDVLKSYKNLESFSGGSKRFVEIPGEGAESDTLNEFYEKLGRPSDANGYGIESDEQTKADVEKFTQMAFENGLTREQAKTMYEAMSTQGNELQQQAIQQYEQQEQNAINDLKDAWGRDFDKHISAGQEAVQRLGIDEETVNTLTDSLGSKAVIELFSKIGARMGEPAFIEGKTSESYGMTSNQARMKMAELKSDQGWVDRYLDGDPNANEQMKMLQEVADGA